MNAPPPTQPPVSPADWAGVTEDRIERLSWYFVEHGDGYTLGMLRAAAEQGGFTREECDAAVDMAASRRHNMEAARPLRIRARVIVLGAYALVYAVLAWGLLSGPSRGSLDFSEIAVVVLTIVLGVALLISMLWVNRRGRAPARLERALLAMLVLPLILLGGVAGLCVVTTRPFWVV